jgi:hypothetical protein
VSSTSGLSTQIIPDNVFSRIITLYVMIVGAIFIPKNLADLLNLIRGQSAYLKGFIAAPGYHHIVLIGDFEIISLRAFLAELYVVFDFHSLPFLIYVPKIGSVKIMVQSRCGQGSSCSAKTIPLPPSNPSSKAPFTKTESLMSVGIL